jgi:hypothetical protein
LAPLSGGGTITRAMFTRHRASGLGGGASAAVRSVIAAHGMAISTVHARSWSAASFSVPST